VALTCISTLFFLPQKREKLPTTVLIPRCLLKKKRKKSYTTYIYIQEYLNINLFYHVKVHGERCGTGLIRCLLNMAVSVTETYSVFSDCFGLYEGPCESKKEGRQSDAERVLGIFYLLF